jgi:hypothetical protein
VYSKAVVKTISKLVNFLWEKGVVERMPYITRISIPYLHMLITFSWEETASIHVLPSEF